MPPRLSLPRLLTALKALNLPSDRAKQIRLGLYFDPSGKGRVAIRQAGVTVVEDLSAITAYGLEDSGYGQGFVRGFIDADFLIPLPARTGFEENDDWIGLLDLLDRYRPTLESQLETHLRAHRAKQAADVEQRALRIARDILDLDEFSDLRAHRAKQAADVEQRAALPIWRFPGALRSVTGPPPSPTGQSTLGARPLEDVSHRSRLASERRPEGGGSGIRRCRSVPARRSTAGSCQAWSKRTRSILIICRPSARLTPGSRTPR